MKAKKALKKLVKAESLLSEVVDQFTPAKDGVREALDAARGSVGHAKAALERSNSSPAAKKASSKKQDPGMKSVKKRSH